MSLLFGQTWRRLACLAVLSVIAMALVGCGAGPGATKTQDPVGFKNIELRQGSTSEISLVNTFSGSELEYSAESSDPSKVKVVVDNDKDTLTVEAVSPGTATITVTAKNSQGSHKQFFTVTVPKPEDDDTGDEDEDDEEDGEDTDDEDTDDEDDEDDPPRTTKHSNCPSPLEIIRGQHRRCTLTKGHSMVYSLPDGEAERIRVKQADRTKNVWTITAVRKGFPVVQIREDKTGNTVDMITVDVPNTSPRLDDDQIPVDSTVPGIVLGITGAEPGFHLSDAIDIAEAFTDEDDVDGTGEGDARRGIFNYKVKSTQPGLLIKTTRGFILEENRASTVQIEAVVLKPFDEDFTIELDAFDRSNDQSDNSVTVRFEAGATNNNQVEPRSGDYTVTQKSNGDFVAVRLGNRLDVDHTLTFKDGFTFADKWDDSLTDGDETYLAGGAIALVTNSECTGNKTPTLAYLASTGGSCYTHTVNNNKVKVDDGALTIVAGDGKVSFELPSEHNGLNSGTGTITIYYHVRAYDKKYANGDAVADDANSKEVIKTTKKALTLSIQKCVVATNCPISSDS